jgi:hypothetical protein
MAWVNTYLNQTPATWAVASFTLKEMLKACGTITRSGDGLSAYSASGDILTHGGSGAGGTGNTGAWWVWQQGSNGVAPYAGTRQLCVQRTTSPVTSARIKYSVAAGFTGGTPSATRVPSATDEQVLLGAGTDASPTYAQLWPTGGAEGSYRIQFRGDDGSTTTNNHTFYVLAYAVGASTTAMVFAFDCCKTGTFPAEDTDPYMIWHLVGDVTASALTAETAGWRGYLKRGMVGEGFVTIPPVTFQSVSSGTFVAPGTLGANPHNGKDDMFPLFWIRRAGLTAPSGYKGQAQMTKMHGPTRSTRDLLSHLLTGDRIVAGIVNFPWPSGTTPTA